jgi:hypothetical protein
MWEFAGSDDSQGFQAEVAEIASGTEVAGTVSTPSGCMLKGSVEGSADLRRPTIRGDLTMLRTTLGTPCLLLGVLWLAACTPESTNEENVSAEDLAATAIDNVERALRGTHRAGSFIADSQSLADSLSTMNDGSDCEYPPCLPDGTCPDPVCQPDEVTVDELQDARAELDEAISDLVQSLRDEIFTAENLEDEDDDSVTFLLGPATLCEASTPTSSDPSAPPPKPEYDQECVDSALRLLPRLRLTSPGEDDVDVELLLTAEKRNVVTLELHHDRLAVVADLGEIKATLDAAGETTNELVSFDGRVSLALEKNAELDYSLTANVIEDVVVVYDVEGQRVTYSVGASVPTMELRLDGNAHQISGGVDYGRIAISGPLDAFSDFWDEEEYDDLGNLLPRKTYTGDVELVVSGIEGRATYDGDDDRLSFTGFGLGDASSTLKWNGITLAQVDLNASLGRHFDVSLQTPQTGGPVLTLSPTLDLSILLNFTPVADQIENIASYLLGDTLRFWFEGESPSVQLDSEQVRVVSGTFNASSSSAPGAAVSVAAGMCIVETDPPTSSHEILGSLSAGTCSVE